MLAQQPRHLDRRVDLRACRRAEFIATRAALAGQIELEQRAVVVGAAGEARDEISHRDDGRRAEQLRLGALGPRAVERRRAQLHPHELGPLRRAVHRLGVVLLHLLLVRLVRSDTIRIVVALHGAVEHNNAVRRDADRAGGVFANRLERQAGRKRCEVQRRHRALRVRAQRIHRGRRHQHRRLLGGLRRRHQAAHNRAIWPRARQRLLADGAEKGDVGGENALHVVHSHRQRRLR